jgi:hypothetical protein
VSSSIYHHDHDHEYTCPTPYIYPNQTLVRGRFAEFAKMGGGKVEHAVTTAQETVSGRVVDICLSGIKLEEEEE